MDLLAIYVIFGHFRAVTKRSSNEKK
uniref:Uncharacterized protein n=1 Tax=Solanum lycopersicum TaxID=4081 RepID=K4B5Y7_SOLLC